MYKHIAVALDGSAHAAAAEDLALALASRLGAMVHGIHVIDSGFLEGAFITDISGAMGFEPFVDLGAQMRTTLEELGGAIRARFSEKCSTAGLPLTFHMEHASVVHGVLGAARLADLLVVGRRGVNARFHDDLLGAATAALLRRSPIPVLVSPEQAALPSRPLAGYDGSPKAARALHHGAELCRALALPLTVVAVDEREERARARLEEAKAYLAPYGVEVSFRLATGEAVEEILLAMLGSGGHDLIMLGAHGRGRIVELVLGSTSEYLARRAPVPVLCVTKA